MLTSITPLGERGRRHRWATTATAYVLTSALAGAALGALLGAVGGLVHPSRTVALAVLGGTAVAAGLLDLTGRRPPSWHRQVDEQWMQTYRGWVYGAGYGSQLGLGVVTIVTSATVYAVLAAYLLTASAATGAVLGVVFGLARALPLLLVRDVRSTQALAALHRRVATGAPVAARIAAAVAIVVGCGAIGGALA